MTKKDFEAAAKMIKAERELAAQQATGSVTTANAIALGMAHIFAEANPRFDREKFLAACGMPR